MTDGELWAQFSPLEADITNIATTGARPAYLAHYTSIEALEKIIQNDELWFSHPFFMNDLQEMRFGIVEGFNIFSDYAREHEFLDACGSESRAQHLVAFFGAAFAAFDLKHAIDIYVLCFSSYKDPEDWDGLLSMWRAYGAHGNGAALIFTTDFLKARAQSPLFAGKVFYASDNDRRRWLADMFRKGIAIFKTLNVPDNQLHIVAIAIFEIMKIFSLLSKHKGFEEEKEWRIIYLPQRDELKLLTDQISYVIGKRGIEPKLKFKIAPLKLPNPETWTFDSIVHQIILGPSLAGAVTRAAVAKMLRAHKKDHFIPRTHPSEIPLRSFMG